MADDYSPAVLALSPLAYWKMNEASGTTFTDSVINNYPLTVANANGIEGRELPYVPGGPTIVDWAGNANSYASRPNSVDLAFTALNSFTIMGWYGSVGSPATRGVFGAKGYNHAGNEQRPWYGCTVEAGGKARMWLRSAAGVDYLVDSFSVLGDANYVQRGPMHFVCGVYDVTVPEVRIYVDGNFEKAAAAATAAWGTNSNAFEMNALNGVGGGPWMGGVAIFDKVIGASDISNLFELGRAGVAWYPYQTASTTAAQQAELDLILASVRKTYTP